MAAPRAACTTTRDCVGRRPHVRHRDRHRQPAAGNHGARRANARSGTAASRRSPTSATSQHGGVTVTVAERQPGGPRAPDATTAGTASFSDHVPQQSDERQRTTCRVSRTSPARPTSRSRRRASPASRRRSTSCPAGVEIAGLDADHDVAVGRRHLSGTCRSVPAQATNTALSAVQNRPRRRSAVRRHAVARAGADADRAANPTSRWRPARA